MFCLLASISLAIDPVELHDTCQQIEKDPHFHMVRNVCTQNSAHAVAKNWDCIRGFAHHFSHEVSSTYSATDQKKSGRCWIFGALNVLRRDVNKKLNVLDFEFSQSYLFFYDKIEKANCFLENIIDTHEESLDSPTIRSLLFHIAEDGGAWHNVVDLIKKYGLVPKSVYPENEACLSSAQLNKVLSIKLTKDAEILRNMLNDGCSLDAARQEKHKMVKEICQILVVHMGAPPRAFDFTYYDKDKKFHVIKDLTPLSFVDVCLETPLDDYVSLSHSPRSVTPYYSNLCLPYSNNLVEGAKYTFLNIPIDLMKQITKDSLLGDTPVSFAADISSQTDLTSGVLNANLYEYDNLYQSDFSMQKGSRLQYRLSTPCHMMAFTGVHLENDVPIRWKVENSWGTEVGNQGFFSMSDNWFDEYVFWIVVPKKYLPEYLQTLLATPPIELPPSDPLWD